MSSCSVNLGVESLKMHPTGHCGEWVGKVYVCVCVGGEHMDVGVGESPSRVGSGISGGKKLAGHHGSTNDLKVVNVSKEALETIGDKFDYPNTEESVKHL